jgi:two-component system phosphate regulon response regulator PhoB
MNTILVVEDEAPVRNLLRFCFERSGYLVTTVSTARQAQKEIDCFVPDLVTLDLGLPDRTGLELLKDWRRNERTQRMPVVVVSGRGDERDRVAGLRAGADDYLCKPFSQAELLARIENILRRSLRANPSEVVEVDGLRIDYASVSVTAHGRPVELTSLGFRMLRYLVLHPNRVRTHEQIIEQVWCKAGVDSRAVYVQVRRLRALLEGVGYGDCIETVRGMGYRFTDRRHATLRRHRRCSGIVSPVDAPAPEGAERSARHHGS